ncbi:MAG: TonB-dependent receptor [Acidimicrobiia bacterium]|nr:TonB-dependent receptor [Acidimicrobiia bacterium]
MVREPAALCLVAALALACSVGVSASAQDVGAIRGTVQDNTGAVLPGVTVVLSNPGVIGGNQQAVTDERGAYQFTSLVPGNTYAVRAELVGFRPVSIDRIVVNASVTVRADMTLQLGQVAEEVTVTAAVPLLDTSTAVNQTVLDRRTLETLPTSNDIWSIGRIVPSVIMSRYDVGGSESLSQYQGSVHGSRWTDSGYLVDGLDTTNPGGTTSASYFDVAMFQETNYMAGNAGAEFEKGGLIYNLVSKTGTNGWHGWTIFSGSNRSMNAQNLSPELKADLIASVPARVLAVNPNFVPSTQLIRYWDVSVGFNGPIVKDKLWFALSGELKRLDQLRVGAYNADGTQGLDDNTQNNHSYKVSWQATPRNQIHYLHQFNNRVNLHRANTLGQVTQFYESRAMLVQDLESPIDQIKWTSAARSNLLFDVAASRYYPVIVRSQQPEVQPGDIPRFDAITNTFSVAQGSYPGRPVYPRYYLHGSMTYVLRNHDLKIGYQYNNQWTYANSYSTSHFPAGLRAVFRNGVPDSVNTYNTPNEVENHLLDQAIYIQDKWQANRRLTVNVGVRVQKSVGWVPAGCQAETIFIAARCFDKVDDIPKWLDASPRFSVIYDLFGDGKTALKGSANRYFLTAGVAHAARVNPMRTTTDTRMWVDANRDEIPQLSELGPSTGFNLGTTNRYNPDVKRPYANELSIEIERQLPLDVVASVGYTYRATRREVGSRNLAVPRASYIPIDVIEQTSGRAVTVYNQDPALRGRFDVLFDNAPELDSAFHGVDITANKRMTSKWMLMTGVSIGRNVGDIYNTGDLNNPNNTFRRGRIEFDVPVSVKMSAAYEFPYGISVSANAQHFTGFPEEDSVVVGANTVRLTQVTQSVIIAPRGTNRLPAVNAFDMALRKRFRLTSGLTAEPALEMFNLGNANTVQGRITILGPAYHRATSIMRGRMLRFGLNVKF